MRSKTMLFTLFMVSVVVLGAILWRNARLVALTTDSSAKTMLLITAAPLRTGTLLRAEDVKWQAWGEEIPAGALVRPSPEERKEKPDADQQALSSVYGAVLRQRLEINQPVLSSQIVKPGDRGFLAAVLSPGYRAVSVAVTAVSGSSGLIFPGDHVDLLLTQKFKQGEEPISHSSVSETIVTNLRVLAADQRLQQTTADPGDNNPTVARTVTLEVLPKQAEMISVAVQLGTLSLTLRSVPVDPEPVTADNSANEAIQSTWADDVSPALKPGKQASAPATTSEIRILRGSKVEQLKD